MGSFSIWHWLIVLVIVMLVFGTKKLRNIGQDLGGATPARRSPMVASRPSTRKRGKRLNPDSLPATGAEKGGALSRPFFCLWRLFFSGVSKHRRIGCLISVFPNS